MKCFKEEGIKSRKDKPEKKKKKSITENKCQLDRLKLWVFLNLIFLV